MPMDNKLKLKLLSIIPFLVFIDLLSKNFMQSYLEAKWKINIIWDFFYLDFVTNSWIAFGFLLNPLFMKIMTIVFIIGLVYLYFKEEIISLIEALAFVLIIAWAVWNWIERFFAWEVIDFIWVKYFAVFNFADIFISLWALLYIFNTLKCLKYIDLKKSN